MCYNETMGVCRISFKMLLTKHFSCGIIKHYIVIMHKGNTHGNTKSDFRREYCVV